MNLDDLRKEIDGLDEQIIQLLNDRTRVALEIGKRKHEHDAPVYVPAREKAVFERVTQLNQGPLSKEHIKAIYREVMSASISLERPVVVAYLGPPATYTHQAALSRFGASVEYMACDTIPEVVAAVEKGQAHYAVVPIENSIEGAVTPTQDSLTETRLKICSEIFLDINHNLLSHSEPASIQKIYSNAQALGQCRKWLAQHVPRADLVPVSSTARAAELAAKEAGAGAVSSHLAAEMYALEIRFDNIQDVSGNTTRFLVLSKEFGRPTGTDKTSLHFGIPHRVGALHNVLSVFDKFGLNMLKIESRPSKSKQWEYYFFVDFEGHVEDEKAQQALEKLKDYCTVLTVLGSFPRA